MPWPAAGGSSGEPAGKESAALTAGGYLRGDPAYGDISVAFGEVSTGAAASIASARFLDQSCAAAD